VTTILDGDTKAELRRETQLAFVELHARITLFMPFVQLLIVSMTASILLFKVPTQLFALWAALAIGVDCGRAAYSVYILRHFTQIDPNQILRIQMALALLVGLNIGIIAPVFMNFLGPSDQIFLMFILIATPAIGVAVTISSRYISCIFAIAILVPTDITWVNLYPQHRMSSALATIAYMVVLAIAAIENEKLIARSVAIRRERDQVVRDLERSNAEVRVAVKRAEDAATARARVLAAASHDLRQPLHALSIYSAILKANHTPETLREVAVHIDELVRELGALLHGLLDLSQLSVGHYVSVRRVFDLEEVVGKVCAEFEQTTASKGLYFLREFEPIVIEGDSMAISRITRNLIDNAVKYTERGGLTIRLRRDRHCAIIVIEDTGKGIDPSEHAHIFEEFYQLGNIGRDRSKGVGLGLTIVERLVMLIGAKISLHSNLGEGSRFELLIPGVTVATPSLAKSDGEITISADSKRRIFVVDDELSILRSMTDLLTSWSFEVNAALDITGTTAMFDTYGCPDLMIVDLRLRGNEHGLTLVNRMRKIYGNFPVIFVTGETSSEALRETRAEGWPLLYKPVDAQTLYRAIQASLLDMKDS
jgi:signal transduction histidine kinase/ActR/RegA family two-component response regulator